MAENRDHSFPLTQQQMEHLAAAINRADSVFLLERLQRLLGDSPARIVQAVAENEQVVLYAITDDRVVLIKAAPTTRERPEYPRPNDRRPMGFRGLHDLVAQTPEPAVRR